ncbi:MAG TPA: hypothetical protein VKR24_09485 [Candidatus Limnocylindrales bacterium]|nr:hypothetical protein [Candidatus Limnocylindrales bacterium]
MAKRARGTTRPGQRRPIQRLARPTPGSAATVAPAGLSAAEITRAAELEAQLVAADRATPTGSGPDRSRAAEAGPATPRRVGVSGRLAVESAEEYRYVARDVRRIAAVGGAMFVILIVLYVGLVLAGVAGH